MRRSSLAMVFVVIASGVAFGTTVFQDDFSMGMNAWEIDSPSYWSVVDGWADVDIPSMPYTFAKAFAGNVNWTDYRFDFDVMGLKDSSKICYFRYQTDTKGYMLNFRGPVPEEGDPGAVRLFRLLPEPSAQWPWGNWRLLVAVPYVNDVNVGYHVSIEVMGPDITVFVNGDEVLHYVDSDDPVLNGRIGLAGFTGANFGGGNHVRWDNVVVSILAVPSSPTTWGRVKALYTE